eukprot:gene6154-4433_t
MSDSKGLGASNEAFILFSFAVVSVIMIVLYIPWLFSIAKETIAFYSAPKKTRTTLENPLHGLKESASFFPSLFTRFLQDPGLLKEGAKVALREKSYLLFFLFPRFLKFIFRPRILLPILWAVLLSSAMYVTLTFDPHAVLGIPRSASTTEVKKAYRNLARRYHPDRNSTDEARVLFTQVRRAYKALVDRDAFEEEEMKNSHDFSVGVALPHFLISREHDGLVLFGLLGILFGLPLIIWYKMNGNNKLEKLIKCINTDKDRSEQFMKHFGIPEDPKYVERRISRQTILRELVQLGICQKNVSERILEKFPPLPDFIQRCVDAEHQKAFLQSLGFNENAIMLLQAHMVANGMKLLETFEAQQAELHKNEDETDPEKNLVSPSALHATKYLYQLHTDEVDRALQELLAMNDSLPSARKLLRLHQDTLDNIETIYAKGVKKNRSAMNQLVQVPQRTAELVDGPSNYSRVVALLQTPYHEIYYNTCITCLSKRYPKRMMVITMADEYIYMMNYCSCCLTVMVSTLEPRKLPKGNRKPKHSLDKTKPKISANKKWEKKMKEKERIQRIRSLSKQIKDDINEEQRREAESRKANQQRKIENEKKNMVVQKIKNEKAIKKLSPKHRRSARIYMLHELN